MTMNTQKLQAQNFEKKALAALLGAEIVHLAPKKASFWKKL